MIDESADTIVITGISGRFPESESVEEFKQHLFDNVDLITEDGRRWPPGLYNLPTRTGKLKNLSHFDAPFFGIHPKQADMMDPQLRILLEVIYEAIVDAGVNPNDIRGSRTAVYVGGAGSEAGDMMVIDPDKQTGYALLGCHPSSFANKVSYHFDFNGPSCVLDTACSSSLFAIQQAFLAIKAGTCDAAIVGGLTLQLKPENCLEFHRLNFLSPEGKCQSFDSSGNGYVRSETVAAVYLQKAKVARRVYASILGVKTNTDGYKREGPTFPSGSMQNKLIRETYTEFGIDPLDVTYVEAHGTGTPAGDPQELNSVAEFFCENRKTPLPIGAVKSNMGHSEAASGLCSLAKVLIVMEAGMIPANLHFRSPNQDIPALSDGRLKVVTSNEIWKGGLIGLNTFGMGGVNIHAILKPNPKVKKTQSRNCLPRIVGVSGRTRDAVDTFLDNVETHKNDDDFLALVHEIYENGIKGHPFRGYCVLSDTPRREIAEGFSVKRPIWFIYSGMGSQRGVGSHLMHIEVFRNSIKQSSKVLKPYGINLEDIIVNGTDSTFKNITNSLVAIVGVQIALTDFLKAVGIEPVGIIGHSVGEIGCAYGDETLTAAQTILCAYHRGKAIEETNLVKGSMAAVGLPWQDVQKRCPPGVYAACHNSKDSTTISGPPDAVEKFVEQLTSENIFVKSVKGCDRAYHTKYMTDAGPVLLNRLKAVITNPKPRTSRWISSSVPESQWSTAVDQYTSADYHVNNLLSPVLFQEALVHVPDNAIVIEVAPTGLFQSILKRALGPDVTYVSLMQRGVDNNLEGLMTALGKLYNAGARPKFANLYPSVAFPVSRGTPMIGPLVKWDHSANWRVPNFLDKGWPGEVIVDVDISKEEDKYLMGHCIDGRVLFPATGYLTLVWKTLAKLKYKNHQELPVVLDDVNIHRATIVPKEGSVKFSITILEKSGEFELCESGTVVVSGRIHSPEDISKEVTKSLASKVQVKEKMPPLTSEDIYKELRLRGYDYSGIFKGIVEVDDQCSTAKLKWQNNWIGFIDTMLQFTIIGRPRDLYLPVRVRKVVINPKEHFDSIDRNDNTVVVFANEDSNIVQSPGVEIRGVAATVAQRRQLTLSSPKLEKYEFVPLENTTTLSESTVLTILLHLVLENSVKTFIKVAVDGDSDEALLTNNIKSILEREPLVFVDMKVLTSEDNCQSFDFDLMVAVDSLKQNNIKLLERVVATLPQSGFLLIVEEKECFDLKTLASIEVVVVGTQTTATTAYALLRKPIETETNADVVKVTEKDFGWVELLKNTLKQNEVNQKKIYLFVQGEEQTGIVGLVNCLKREPGGERIRAVFIQDVHAPTFSLLQYSEQLKKDLVHNVLKKSVWGTYRHIPFDGVKVPAEHAYINTMVRGDLSSFQWVQSSLDFHRPDESSKELFQVCCAPLNFRDVMIATGNLPLDALPESVRRSDCPLGLEFSGFDRNDRRVMGLVTNQSLATTVLAGSRFIWSVPIQWSMEEAATVPAVYATSYYAMVVRGHMKKGETILIHAGTGGVGLAAITIALSMGCKVFTTVGSQEKRDFLKATFPELTDDCIGHSRDSSFENLVLRQTNARGVDLVLNSLSGKLLQASVRCLAEGGRFLEIGKADLYKDAALGMSVFLKNGSVHGILMDLLFYDDRDDGKEVWNLVNKGILNGTVKPLPRTVFTADQVEQAFRFMASGKHIGKVIVKIRDEKSKPYTVMAVPRTYMHPDKTYIIIGGLGGLGLELSNWLIQRGATKIILTSRSGIRTRYQSLCVQRWTETGTKILIYTKDTTTAICARQLLEVVTKIGPVGGIFNLAMVLRDALMENQTEADFQAVCKPKIDITRHLDAASKALCPHLDYFVTFSSMACGRGNPGQSNYGFANSTMERICEKRRKLGLPGLAIQWGAVGDVGFIIDNMGENDLQIGGTVPQRIPSCLSTLDIFLQQSSPTVSSMVLADKHSRNQGDKDVGLVDTIANILGIKDSSTIAPSTLLTDFGMDSLMAAEIKQILEHKFDVMLNPEELRTMTFKRLAELEKGSQQDSGEDAQEEKHTYAEIMPSECLICMKAKESEKEPVFVVHPIEGVVSMLQPLAENIQMPVYGLQCTRETPTTSFEDMAAYYNEKIRTVQPVGPYTLIGYSYGGALAFEMGLQLESCGERAQLFLIDGSPTFITTYQGKDSLAYLTEDAISADCKIFSYIASKFMKLDLVKTVAELTVLKTFEDRLERITAILSNSTQYSESDISAAVVSCYHKVMAGSKYHAKSKFKGKVTLVKATKTNTNLTMADDGLSEICSGGWKMHTVEGNHTSILTGAAVKEIADIFHSEVLSD